MLEKRKRRATTDRLIQHKLKLDQRKSAFTVKVEIENERGISLHIGIIQKRAHEVGLIGRVAHRKPHVSKINRGKRLKFAEEMFEKLGDFWKNIVWSDGWKFNLFRSDSKVMVWRMPGEEFGPKCTIPMVKHGGASVMIWGCFIRQGVVKLCVLDSIMDRFYYRDILKQNLQPSINHFNLGQRCIFMHDNDPKYTSGLIKNWLKRKRIQTLACPLYLNPIQDLWDEFERRVKKHQPKSKTELELLLIPEWNKIELPALAKLVDSVHSRLYESIKTKGYPIKY